ncbi:phosphodiesterase [Aceticella autotrophica]|uniref:Phosphoesterase n=1 Tax=Aceticella autotrophica TaxID=2755338 RepID=A0A975AWL1_9THEO|nr:phosphodiesterase [Aceticella autotrophica]QSZ27795.1 phosphodiesterase [Aceticella autotrophica]
MKIGVVSDTHGDYKSWEKAWDFLNDVDIILHAGDVLYHGPRNQIPEGYDPKKLSNAINTCSIPILVSEGNCDAYVDQMMIDVPIQTPYVYSLINGKKFMIQHGHNISDEDIHKLVKKYKLDYFITGHTHIPLIKKIDGCVLINPGSTSLSKREDKINSIGLIENGTVHIIDLETGKDILILNDKGNIINIK